MGLGSGRNQWKYLTSRKESSADCSWLLENIRQAPASTTAPVGKSKQGAGEEGILLRAFSEAIEEKEKGPEET